MLVRENFIAQCVSYYVNVKFILCSFNVIICVQSVLIYITNIKFYHILRMFARFLIVCFKTNAILFLLIDH